MRGGAAARHSRMHGGPADARRPGTAGCMTARRMRGGPAPGGPAPPNAPPTPRVAGCALAQARPDGLIQLFNFLYRHTSLTYRGTPPSGPAGKRHECHIHVVIAT